MVETVQPARPVWLLLLLLWQFLRVQMACSSFGDTSFVVSPSITRARRRRNRGSWSFVSRAPIRRPRSSSEPQQRSNKPWRTLSVATATEAPSIPILLETERFLVIDKPAGIPHHSDPPTLLSRVSGTTSLGILHLLRAQRGRDTTNERLYGVHRLDRDTSGILLVAKDAAAAAVACRAFREGRVSKYYTGLSCHKPSKKKQGWIQGNMVRGRRKSWYLTSNKDSNDTDVSKNFAKTRFFSAGLGHLPSLSGDDDMASNSAKTASAIRTLLLFRPYTGQTHQLRVAAKSVGLPLAGDPIYKDNNNSAVSPSARMYLHAMGLHIPASALSSSFSPDESIDRSDLTVWCPPPFEATAWKDNPGAQAGFRQVLHTLVEKHCECPPLLELATAAHLSIHHHHHHQQQQQQDAH